MDHLRDIKTRLVAKRYNQQKGLNYGETYKPAVKPITIHLIFSIPFH